MNKPLSVKVILRELVGALKSNYSAHNIEHILLCVFCLLYFDIALRKEHVELHALVQTRSKIIF
jgi:hypothetical protein